MYDYDNIIGIIYSVQKYRRATARARVFSRVCCVDVRYWLTALSSLGFRFRKRRRPAAEGRDEIPRGSVGGGAANAVRQCCHVAAVAGTRCLRPVSVHVAGVFCFFLFSHSQRRRTRIRRARQCDRRMPIPERSRYQ